MSGAFTAKYSDRQRLAVALSFDPPRVSSAQVSERAAAGRLPDVDGWMLEPFEIPAVPVRTVAARVRRGGNGESDGGIAAAGLQPLYERLSQKAARLRGCVDCREIARAARVLDDLEQLRGRLLRAPNAMRRRGSGP